MNTKEDELLHAIMNRLGIPIAVGRASIAWNSLHHTIFQTFETLANLEHRTAISVFFAIKSDRSQRDVVDQLIGTELLPKGDDAKKLGKKFRAALGECNAIAGKRNDTLHIVFVNDENMEKTKTLQDVGYLKGKSGKQLMDAIDDLTIETLTLALRFDKLNTELMTLSPYSNRPILAALRAHIARRKPQATTIPEEYGHLDVPAKSQSNGE